MAHIPNIVSTGPLMRGQPSQRVQDYLERLGYTRVHQGKVRDTYEHSDLPDILCVVATDRLSIFDFVLPEYVERKGEVLTALTHFWLTDVLKDIPNHLIEPPSLPEDFPLERCLFVRKLAMQPFELIFRSHLGGSVWKQYLADGTVAGQKLPEGLQQWQVLGEPLFTPSTKADIGHDVNISTQQYLDAMGVMGLDTIEWCRRAYMIAYEYAKKRGILILDTKFEASTAPFCLADEDLTPDSSRFTAVEDYEVAMVEGRDPIFFDKQPIREWGKTVETPFVNTDKNDGSLIVGINSLKPEIYEHRNFVDGLDVPISVLEDASSRYLKIFEMLVGIPLSEYQQTRMGVHA